MFSAATVSHSSVHSSSAHTLVLRFPEVPPAWLVGSALSWHGSIGTSWAQGSPWFPAAEDTLKSISLNTLQTTVNKIPYWHRKWWKHSVKLHLLVISCFIDWSRNWLNREQLCPLTYALQNKWKVNFNSLDATELLSWGLLLRKPLEWKCIKE